MVLWTEESSQTNTNRKLARKIVDKLTNRPESLTPDGFYDLYADERQMINIIEKLLDKERS